MDKTDKAIKAKIDGTTIVSKNRTLGSSIQQHEAGKGFLSNANIFGVNYDNSIIRSIQIIK